MKPGEIYRLETRDRCNYLYPCSVPEPTLERAKAIAVGLVSTPEMPETIYIVKVLAVVRRSARVEE